jgi:hypothetical protein
VRSRKIVPFYRAPAALNPDAMKIVYAAFERAEQDLRDQGALSDVARAALARTVIELAEHGMRCPTLLSDAAVARFGKAA